MQASFPVFPSFSAIPKPAAYGAREKPRASLFLSALMEPQAARGQLPGEEEVADDAGGLLHVLQGPHLRHRGLAANLDGTEVLHRVVIGVVAAVAAGGAIGRIVPKGGPPRGELPAKEEGSRERMKSCTFSFCTAWASSWASISRSSGERFFQLSSWYSWWGKSRQWGGCLPWKEAETHRTSWLPW